MQLQMITQSDLRFERIVSIKEEEFEGTLYDLTVEDNHNYIANGLLVSNCMGTIHANSPQETVIRIKSPPMNVPEVMLSGLDLIIVEHRIHDKRKGTIRRITEIAELTGVLEGKAQTQTIFERNPIDDTVERTNIPSNYLKKIERFTGVSRKQIETEITERKKFLDDLVRKKIREMPEVSRLAHEFLVERSEGDGSA
jgi:flagellar protein FlaI